MILFKLRWRNLKLRTRLFIARAANLYLRVRITYFEWRDRVPGGTHWPH